MTEQRTSRPELWFHKITPGVLAGAGPRKTDRKGVDLTTGQATPPPGDNLTKDLYEQVETARRRR